MSSPTPTLREKTISVADLEHAKTLLGRISMEMVMIPDIIARRKTIDHSAKLLGIIQGAMDQPEIDEAETDETEPPAKTLAKQPLPSIVVTTAPLVHEPSSSVLPRPVKKGQPNVDPLVLAVLAMLPGWCANRDMKFKGVLEKIQREIPRFIDLISHLMEMVPRFHAYLTVGEALELLERHTSQRSRNIDLQDLMSKVKPAKLPKPRVTSATRKAQHSRDAALL
jgi:hypothetical protein